ncbi:hypothetical protein BCR43DRAFT_517475 [Syncephalastrum racemosum]|uniref:STI1 domain-containing protein n=1 Tax=Syncephalastrum racemosum TaxID=13706 RepID=A0A1X2H4B0_SYNRA|nr:hypothetical protein BCR43DRAFT_517475 [Syncephalastrum racemosum]
MRHFITLAIATCILFVVFAHAAPATPPSEPAAEPVEPVQPAQPAQPGAAAPSSPGQMLDVLDPVQTDEVKKIAKPIKMKIMETFMKNPEMLAAYRDTASKLPGFNPATVPSLAMCVDNPKCVLRLLVQFDFLKKPSM